MMHLQPAIVNVFCLSRMERFLMNWFEEMIRENDSLTVSLRL